MKELMVGFKVLLALTLLTGVFYPAVVTVYSSLFVADKAHGSLIEEGPEAKGSELLAQKFTAQKYFWSRPSAIDYNSSSSGASNWGPLSADLKKQVETRENGFKMAHPAQRGGVPQDLLFASGSGLDPHISPAAALFQVERVALARQLDSDTLRNLVNQMTEQPQYAIFGEARVNVLKLNIALDRMPPP